MRRIVPLVAAFAAAAALSASALAGDAAEESVPMSHGRQFDEQGGAEIFRDVCAACHQADARGAVGAAAYPALAGDKELASADFVLSVLFKGLRAMPPLGTMMSDQQAADVVNYLRTHFGNSYADAVTAAQAGEARRAAAP